MNNTQQKTAGRGPADRAAIQINDRVILTMIAGTVFALLLLIAGVYYESDWFLMLAIYFTVTSFVRSYLLLPVRKTRNTRSRIIKGYQKYRLTGIILIVVQTALLAFIILRRAAGFYYPMPALIGTAVFALLKLYAIYKNMRAYQESEGPYVAGLRLIDLGELLTVLLLIVHLIVATLSGIHIAAGLIWIITAIVFGVMLCCSVYMVIFAGGELRTYQEGSGQKKASAK